MNDLAHVPSGTRIFVDASILALYFTDHPCLADACEVFLLRCVRKELIGFTFARVSTLHVWGPTPLSP